MVSTAHQYFKAMSLGQHLGVGKVGRSLIPRTGEELRGFRCGGPAPRSTGSHIFLRTSPNRYKQPDYCRWYWCPDHLPFSYHGYWTLKVSHLHFFPEDQPWSTEASNLGDAWEVSTSTFPTPVPLVLPQKPCINLWVTDWCGDK